MTLPSTDTLEREKDKLYVTDAELIRRRPVSPEAFAKEMGWPVKRVRRLARHLGACRILGRSMTLMPEDVQRILEHTQPCPSPSIAAPEALSGTTAGQLPDIDAAGLLAHLTRKKPRELHPRSKPTSATVVALNRRRS